LRTLLNDFSRWSAQVPDKPHFELAEQVLEESGYTDFWKQERSAEAEGRLENLKELIRSMEEFPDLGAFLEHVSLVMDVENAEGGERVSIMTLHGAKGLEFDTVFLPGWEEGLFPHQRSLDENGRAGLEEERRLAYVGVTRARRRAKILFASNRRIHGLWQSTVPSRFIDDLPAPHVQVVNEARSGGNYGAYAQSRFANMDNYGSHVETPGWRRAQTRAAEQPRATTPRAPKTIDGEIVSRAAPPGKFAPGARIFHQKFGPGLVAAVDGSKLTIDFDKAGRKLVLDSFVELRG
jgi:DNA helicase-2/ATP-dependent DNA helicase PcrA